MEYGLKDELIEHIVSVFKSFAEVNEVIIYGSRAKGNFKPGSDIDLTVKGKNLNQDLLNTISLKLDDLLTPYTFDLSVYSHIKNADLIDHIQRVGKVFYKKD